MSITARINKKTKTLFYLLISSLIILFAALLSLNLFFSYKTKIYAVIILGILFFLIAYTFDFNKTYILKDGFINVYRGKKNKLIKKFKVNDSKTVGLSRVGFDIYAVLDSGNKIVIFPLGSLNHDEAKFFANTVRRIPRVTIKDKKGLLLK